ncbi:lamin tail domain-containing protein [Nostoc piscinale]|uniref:lamin tail domain-containing protein n=1 Tax=Nostoc piscinale TaxID=224012 RepID=UPI00078403AC|nr:lamin tail domain-containing protein [Nostoc piscinale]
MKSKIKNILPNSNSRQLITSLAFCLCILGQGIQSSQAEGSKELIANGGYRPYLVWSSTITLAGIPFKTTLKVYVEQGEIVYLGSSVHNNTQDIVYRSPFNGQNGSCDVLNTGYGLIDTLDKESKGPEPLTPGGYTPCQFTATETGIYEVEFRSQTANSTSNPTPVTTTAEFSGINQRATVAAWDITVSRNGVPQKGRVFSNYVALNMGENAGINGAPSDVRLNSQLFIQTKDGYRYRTEMNGLDPFGFIFFANSRGYIDSTNNSTLYHSITSPSDNTLNFDGNVKVQRPDVADTATDITHLVFFNRPATETLVAVGIPLTATPPVIPQNFLFTGGTGGSGNQTFVGVGGNFSFNATSGGSYQIIIDTNTDGIFDPSVDRVLQNVMLPGQNVVPWNGKDANGVNLQPRPGNQPYNAQITTRGGEYHFPLLDAENNSLGFKITMENPPGAFPNFQDQNGQNIGTSTVYYNDSNYTTANGTPISLDGTGATSPRNASRGISSTGGEHEFNSRYGDYKGIDTWTFFPSQAVFSTLVITTDKQANVRGTKSVRFLTDNDNSNTLTVGDRIQYTITYSNLSPGTSDAINFVINDTLPSQLTFVSAAITSATSGNNITRNSNYNGSGALTNSGTLRVGDTITITITATINSANNGNPISNQASATFSTPDNPSVTAGTVVTDADSAGSNTNSPSVGGYVIQIANDGVNTGNNPSNTGDDEPTLFTVGNILKYTVSPLAGKVIINEVLYNETTNNLDEFIELYNASSSTVDLSGFKLADGNLIANNIESSSNRINYTFPNGTILRSGEYAVIWIGSNNANTQATGAAVQLWMGLSSNRLTNAGDDVWLYDSQNQIIDYIAYGTGNAINTPPPSSLNLWDSTDQASLAGAIDGESISLTRNGNDTNTSACWERTTSTNASSRCPSYLPTRDTDNVGTRVTSVGVNNNGSPKIVLVKRITRINNNDLNDSVDGAGTDDNDSKWPSGYLRGKISATDVKPGDEVEYTIYFLSNGSSSATNVKFCDLVPTNTTFIENAFNGLTPNNGLGGNQGIAFAVGTTNAYLTNAADSDRGVFL